MERRLQPNSGQKKEKEEGKESDSGSKVRLFLQYLREH